MSTVIVYFHCHVFIDLKVFYAPPINFSLTSPQSLATADIFTVSIVLLFPECHIVGIIQYVAFSDRLFSLNNMNLSFLTSSHGLIVHLFLGLNNILWLDIPQFICPLTHGRTSWLFASLGNYE